MVQVNNEQMEQMLSNFETEQSSEEILTNQGDASKGILFQSSAASVVDMRAADGRPASIQLFNWEGSPSEIPIAYDPGGTNPSISRYLRKKHCNACGANGFIGNSCRYCGSRDVIRLFYQKYSETPHKRDFYGEIPCLFSVNGEMDGSCPRDGVIRNNVPAGFLSRQQMLMHVTSKHRKEYEVWQAMARQPQAVDTDKLRKEIMEEILAALPTQEAPKQVQEEDPSRIHTKTCNICDKPFKGKSNALAQRSLNAHVRLKHST